MTPEERCKLYDAALAEAAGWLPRFRVTTGLLRVPIPETVWEMRSGFRVNATPSAIPYFCFRCGLEISGGDIRGWPYSVRSTCDGKHVIYRVSLPAARIWLQTLVELIPGAEYGEQPYAEDARAENKKLRALKPWRSFLRWDCLQHHKDANAQVLRTRAWMKWEAPAGFEKGCKVGTARLRVPKGRQVDWKSRTTRPVFTHTDTYLVFRVGEHHETVPALPLRGSGELRFQHSTYVARRYAIDAKGAAWLGIRDLPLELSAAEELLRVCFDEEERAKIAALLGASS